MFQRVTEAVYIVGGAELSHQMDCLVYALDVGDLVLVDCGAGRGWGRIRDNMFEAGLNPDNLHTLILTHAHVDHIGGVREAVEGTGCRVAAHALDVAAIESGDPAKTASSWYGISLPRIKVDHVVKGNEETLEFKSGNSSRRCRSSCLS